MHIKLSFLLLALVIEGSQSIDVISEGILFRIEALEKKDSELTEVNTRLLTIIENQKEQLKQKDVTIDHLMKQMNFLAKIEKDNQNLKALVSNLQEKIGTLEVKVSSSYDIKGNEHIRDNKLRHSLESYDGRVGVKSEFLNAILRNKTFSETTEHIHASALYQEKAIRNIGQTTSAPELVAFHAISDRGEIPHVGVNQNIVFETVMMNLASAYHAQHGIFIAPTNGLYLFSTSILADNNGKAVYADLVKNGAVLARVQGQGNSGYDQGSVTVVTQLNASDEVWVRLYCCADDTLYGGRYTSFTGVMITAV